MKQTRYILLAGLVVALVLLNPGRERHHAAFMANAQERFFDLSPDYRTIFQEEQIQAIGGKESEKIVYSNFLLFSMLRHIEAASTAAGKGPKARLLTFGLLGVVLPITS